ncbi:MAG: hypothetical protein JNM63_05875, partial [Spirochaetia bacterium]|nr:hypothetical protein [Spirochaetia bacterium]
ASGFDKSADPGGLWDSLLSQRRRIGTLGTAGTSLLRVPAEAGEAGMLEGMRMGARSVGEGESRIEISLSQARSGGQASLVYGEKGELQVSAAGSFSELLVVGEKDGLPGAILANLKTSGKYSFEATRPTYFRAVGRTDGVTKAVSAPVFLDVRPAFRERIALSIGQVALFKDPGKGASEKLEYIGKEDFFPITLGAEACREVLIPFTAKEAGFYYLELGLDPGKQCQGPEEKLEVFLEGKTLGTYRADNPIQGIKVQHLIPFRVPLGKWPAQKAEKIRLVSSAPGDGIGIAYAFVIRGAFPFMALADSHAHSKAEDDFSDKLHRTMGYNYISTAHGQLPDTARRQQALALAEKLTDSQMILQIGGERGDRFGANHVSIAFHQPSFEDYDKRDDNYSSGISLGLQWKGTSIINHPDND